MKRSIRRIVIATVLATAGTSAQAASCGTGTVQTVLIGAWGWEGLHIVMNHNAGTAPPATSFWATDKIRFLKSSFADDDYKTLKAAILLAYANGRDIEVKTFTNNTSGVQDCSKATEIVLLP